MGIKQCCPKRIITFEDDKFIIIPYIKDNIPLLNFVTTNKLNTFKVPILTVFQTCTFTSHQRKKPPRKATYIIHFNFQ